ncbi:MAG: ABC transporter permease [Cytophagales bacterium]|nr:ABC transporter permease [Cytophagales bacterium]
MTSSQKHNKKKVLGSYPFTVVLFSIFLSLTVLGLFGSLLILVNSSTDFIKKNIELHVYLQQSISENQRIKVIKLLSSKPYVNKQNNKAEITYISQQEAKNKYINDTGEDFSGILSVSPIPSSIKFKVHPEYSKLNQLQIIKTEIEKMQGVFEVDLNEHLESLIVKIHNNIQTISIVMILLTALSSLTIIILINNTIKLALFSQRFLIRSMQLVGATAGFIQAPFLKRAGLHGLLAGLISSSVIYGLLMLAQQNFYGGFQQIYTNSSLYILILLGALPLLGMFIGLLSSFRAVKKYLQMSLDDLY